MVLRTELKISTLQVKIVKTQNNQSSLIGRVLIRFTLGNGVLNTAIATIIIFENNERTWRTMNPCRTALVEEQSNETTRQRSAPAC